jgi:acyl-CoA hydrolase
MLYSRRNPEVIEKKSHREKSNRRATHIQIIYVKTDNQEDRPIHIDCFDEDNEKLGQNQIKTPVSAVSESQVVMLCSRRRVNYVISFPLIQEKRKLFEDPQVYFVQEEENTIEERETFKSKYQMNTEERTDLNCFDKGSGLLVKDQIKI